TYYGSSDGYDVFNDIKVTSNNYRYVTGYTTSGNFPKFNSTSLFKGFKDAVILKYSAGDSIRFASFYGGASDDIGNSIDVNSAGEIFVGGRT
ncbi:UNVERIFIED_CONTAM: hypothetical protein IGO34_28880, partial [Salmonella enterica subsp. enterica serovar Weltevreden]